MICTLFVSIAALGISCIYARCDMGAPEHPRWSATVNDLKQVCELKRAAAAQYEHEAAIARRLHCPVDEQLYSALALSENIHVRNYSRALSRLGSRYVHRACAPASGADQRQSLTGCIALERHMVDRRHAASIAKAINDSSKYAARVAAWAAGSDVKHIILLENRILSAEGRCRPASGYVVCPICGNTSDAEHAECYCPFCMTPDDEYVRFDIAGDNT